MTGSFNTSEKSELGSMFTAPATSPAGTQSGGALSATTTPSRYATSSRAFSDAIPTAADVSSADGPSHRISSIPGWFVSGLFALLFVVWVR